MKRTLLAMCACLLLCSACKNHRNTSIFTPISESEAISDGDSLFLHAYQCVEEVRPTLNQLSIHDKAKLSDITYNDIRKFFQETSDPATYDKYRAEWHTAYGKDEHTCDSLLVHYQQVCDWELMTAEEQIGWHYYFSTHNIVADPIHGWKSALMELLVPPVIQSYWRYPSSKDRVIKELVNPQYLKYKDYYTQKRFPALFELWKALGYFD